MERYNDQVEAIGGQVLNDQRPARGEHERVGDSLELYRERLSDFVSKLEVDKYLDFCLENHAEELSELLQAIIENSSEKIGNRVSDHLRTSDAAKAKLGERQEIRAAIDFFDQFRRVSPSRLDPGSFADPGTAAMNVGAKAAREPAPAMA